jgi:hypothetical protein
MADENTIKGHNLFQALAMYLNEVRPYTVIQYTFVHVRKLKLQLRVLSRNGKRYLPDF